MNIKRGLSLFVSLLDVEAIIFHRQPVIKHATRSQLYPYPVCYKTSFINKNTKQIITTAQTQNARAGRQDFDATRGYRLRSRSLIQSGYSAKSSMLRYSPRRESGVPDLLSGGAI